MKRIIMLASALGLLAACGSDYDSPTNPEIVAKLKLIEPDMPLPEAEAILGDPVAFTIAPDKKSHCKAYLYHNQGSEKDWYAIVYYVQNKVKAVESGHGATSCVPTTAPNSVNAPAVMARPVS